jgi:alkyl hydroperoxide reductase subunit F
MYDLAIIGGGPAGVAAGVYAARKQLKTVFLAEVIGGQSTDSLEIQNWIGTEKIAGLDLAKSLEAHLRAYAGEVVTLKIGSRVSNITKTESGFSIETAKETVESRAILIATGGSRRKLAVPGASEFENKGLTYCASCDGPLFSGQEVVVVGGGNAGFESAAQLLAYCKKVTLVHRGSDFSKADPTTTAAVKAHPNFVALTDSQPTEVKGDAFVKSIVIKNTKTGSVEEILCAGIFVEIGMVPSTDFAKTITSLDAFGRVVVNPKNQRVLTNNTEVAGLWSAGDCTDELYHQNNIAAGDAVKALEDIYFWIKAQTPLS